MKGSGNGLGYRKPNGELTESDALVRVDFFNGIEAPLTGVLNAK
jgi:hypothetical protein